jgi:nitroreductase
VSFNGKYVGDTFVRQIHKNTIVIMDTITNEVLKVIYERRAVRKFKGKSVDESLIQQVLDAGRMAPSAINRQPWKFYVLTNRESIKLYSKEIAKSAAVNLIKSGIKNIMKTTVDALHMSRKMDFLKGEDPVFHGAPVVIFMVSPKDNEWAALDIGMCSQNIMLAAKSLGLDTCPVGLAKYVEQTNLYAQLNIPASEQVNLAIILGYGDEDPAIHERKKDNVVFIN